MNLRDVIAFQYAHTAQAIHALKQEAYKATEEKQQRGFNTVTVQRVTSWMNPKHPKWNDYQRSRRLANILLGAKLLLKYNDQTVPEPSDMHALVTSAALNSQAGTRRGRKFLARHAHKLLIKVQDRLEKDSGRYAEVEEWLQRRKEATHA